MSKMKTFSAFAAASAVAVLMGSAAGAATLSLVGGQLGSIPDGAVNDGLAELGLNNPLDGYYGANVWLDGPAKVTVTLLGSEAGYINSFHFAGETLTAGNNATVEAGGVKGIWDASGALGQIVANVSGSGFLDFWFTSNGSDPVYNMGTNPSEAGTNPGGPADGITSFFASFAGNERGTSGNSLYLFLDDGGAGPDDNHDDLVLLVSVAPIPLPAAGWLLLGGLGALGVARRRRKAA